MLAQVPIPAAVIADFRRRNGVRKFAFFGSMLTDRFSDESDIDVLVEFRPAERVGFFRLAEMEEELSRLFGSRRVDLRTPADLSVYFRDEVVRNALVAYVEP